MMKQILYFILFIVFVGCAPENKSPEESQNTQPEVPPTPPEKSSTTYDYDTTHWVEFEANELVKLDIRYATADNFTEQQIYDCPRCFLRKPTANKLRKAIAEFAERGYGVILFDCYRPHSAQQMLWDIVPNPIYVADPKEGSMHNKGLAVDMSLMDRNKRALDMGTGYDHFGPEAHHGYSDLKPAIQSNRQVLRDVMLENGFIDINSEWWHYSDPGTMSKIEEFEWRCDE